MRQVGGHEISLTQEFSSKMEGTQPQNDDTPVHEEENAEENTTLQPVPTDMEAVLVTDEHVDFINMLETLLIRFDSRDELTRRTNERLETLAYAQTTCRHRLDNINQKIGH